MIAGFLGHTLDLYLDAAPWLLLGLLAAGLVRAWVPQTAMERWLGGAGSGPILRAALVGAPLPLCSCGVLPAAVGLRRAGASRGATVSFLVATPETGVDSVAVTYALMGPFMAVVRPIAAILSALFAGWFAERVSSTAAPAGNGCGEGCCNGACSGPDDRPGSPLTRTLAGLHYAVTDILDDIAPWLAAGLLVAGAIATAVPAQALAAWGSGPAAMLLMLLAGVPLYVCATASTPLAVGLLFAGLSPGTVLVFLLAGPATNLASLAVLRRELGNGVMAAYLAAIAGASVGLGLLTDALAGALGVDVTAQLGAGGEFVPIWLAAGTGILLALFAWKPLRRRLLRFIPLPRLDRVRVDQ
jgi:uncharacterized membrane protein YraQ (UPF0718 family)